MASVSEIPRDGSLDGTLALVSEGYTFVSDRCRRLQSDVFQTRLLLRPVICMQGEAAAELFYDDDRFRRRNAAPTRVKKTLFGQGGVQGLDGDAHRRRKQMFMSLMTSDGIDALVTLASEQWTRYIETWEETGRVVLFDAVRELLCRAVCSWTGVPLRESEVEQRTADLGAMIDGSGAIGLRHWQGRRARTRAERWLEERITQVRDGTLETAEESALHAVSWHRTPDDELLDPKTAAVELLNVLRPTVAVARYVVFAAHALHEHPASRARLRAGTDDEVERFVQEVRRLYPFFPFVGARVRTPFTWNGYRFPDGQRTVLDLYGTNHDARVWDAPDTFRPTRFQHWDERPFDFIPQGGGDHTTGHRCPGEWITIALMKHALHVLTEEMRYTVPEQDLRIPLSDMPALPNSRFVIDNVHSPPNTVTYPMANTNDKPKEVPPQHQEKQPGSEQEMSPEPDTIYPDYRGSRKLEGKTAIVTGGDSGIGRAAAVMFAREGADVSIVYLDEHDDAEETKDWIEQEGRQCILIDGDVGDKSFCEKAVEETVDAFGDLNVVVNNAAVQFYREQVESISEEQLDRTFRTNIYSMFFLVQAARPHLSEGDSIINTTSITAFRGKASLLDYASTKGAILSYTRSLAGNLVEDGIRVNAVAPGPIWTPLIPASFPDEYVDDFGKSSPMGRPGQPEEVGPSYVFLASKDASYMTGQTLHPNGGEIIGG